MCNSGAKTETTKPFFLALPITCQWKTKSPWRPSSDRSFCYKFWWTISMKYCNVSDEFNDKINGKILLCTIYYIKSTKCFEKMLLTSTNLPHFLIPHSFWFFSSIYVLSFISTSVMQPFKLNQPNF